jgi:ATP-dependent exoDNAse (exonuclease V) beta subunit
MTRARERLIMSGAAKLEAWPERGESETQPAVAQLGGGPIAWIGPALQRLPGVGLSFVRPEDATPVETEISRPELPPALARVAPPPTPQAPPGPPVRALSYSSLSDYKRCGYRFYAERVLRLPPSEPRGWAGAGLVPGVPGVPGTSALGLNPLDRGTLVHALLERLDFRRPLRPTDAMIADACARTGLRPVPPGGDAAQVAALVERFGAGELCRRLGRATSVRREERFRFLLGSDPHPPVLIGGVFDVIAREPGGRTLVVDYKTDRLEGDDPQALADRAYGIQRLVYALAALRAGAQTVEVVHTFLELPQRPAVAVFEREQAPALEAELSSVARGVLAREFTVTDSPHRAVCQGCPAEGGLCSWPLELTRREEPDRLF